MHHLQPGIKKDAWTAEEEAELVRVHKVVGNRYAPQHWSCTAVKVTEYWVFHPDRISTTVLVDRPCVHVDLLVTLCLAVHEVSTEQKCRHLFSILGQLCIFSSWML